MRNPDVKIDAGAALSKDLAALLSNPDAKAGPRRVVRLMSYVPAVDLLAWLQNQPEPDKIFWSDREHAFAVAGIGAAGIKTSRSGRGVEGLFEELRAELSSGQDDLRYYGGFRFDLAPARDAKWGPFGTYRFVLPQFELVAKGDDHYVACNVVLPDTAKDLALAKALRERLETLETSATPSQPEIPEVLSRSDRPGLNDWCDSVRDLLDAFESGTLEKVVLARESSFHLAGEADPVALLQILMANTGYSYHYLFQPEAGSAFIGASPEQLYKRVGAFLQSEAIAGTRPRGSTPEEDKRLGKELLTSEKERREHLYVLDSIRDLFNDRCKAVQGGDDIELLKLRHCQHLLTRIEGRLDAADCDSELLAGLHPTPAVGGIPRDEALECIRATEPFERGWYTGPMGWVGRDATEFAVAIRSALVRGSMLSVYAGAGIVPGSEPQDEWDELENKIADFRSILERAGAPREMVQP